MKLYYYNTVDMTVCTPRPITEQLSTAFSAQTARVTVIGFQSTRPYHSESQGPGGDPGSAAISQPKQKVMHHW